MVGHHRSSGLLRLSQSRESRKASSSFHLDSDPHWLTHMPRTCSGDATLEMPLRKWSIELHLVGPHGEDIPADCFEKVVYKLHETFGQRATQSGYI